MSDERLAEESADLLYHLLVGAVPFAQREMRAAGLDKLRSFEAQEARDLLTKAVQAEPDFPLAHSALASATAAVTLARMSGSSMGSGWER